MMKIDILKHRKHYLSINNISTDTFRSLRIFFHHQKIEHLLLTYQEGIDDNICEIDTLLYVQENAHQKVITFLQNYQLTTQASFYPHVYPFEYEVTENEFKKEEYIDSRMPMIAGKYYKVRFTHLSTGIRCVSEEARNNHQKKMIYEKAKSRMNSLVFHHFSKSYNNSIK